MAAKLEGGVIMLILEIAAGIWLLNAAVGFIVGLMERSDRRAAWEAEFRRRDAIDTDPGIDFLIGRYRC